MGTGGREREGERGDLQTTQRKAWSARARSYCWTGLSGLSVVVVADGMVLVLQGRLASPPINRSI